MTPLVGFEVWFAQAAGTSLDLAVIAIYLIAILAFGAFFGLHTRSTRDFFTSGQRFSAWLVTASYIATLVGSYSFLKYSEAAYNYGLSSTSTYLNDWFILPLFMFAWLPIVYFNRILSVPEYFERRFGRATRAAGTVIILLYMLGYIGYNLFTIAVALRPIVGLTEMQIVWVTAIFCGIYVTAGGQTSVIMTDLLQGVLLLAVGFGVLFLGMQHLGGWSEFWGALPTSHKYGMADFNTPDGFNAVGLFWQDGIANSFAFYFMNQGILLRFLSTKSPAESRKAVVWIALVMMPLTAIAVSSAGWIGAALAARGEIDVNESKDVFVTVSKLLTRPGVFGLVLAALTAALMSTIDTLINAVSAVCVNDIYRPLTRSRASERHYLRVARVISLATAGFGVVLVPLFMSFKSLYVAHATFTAAITPPLVIVILFGSVWPRFGGRAALTTILCGSVAIFFSFAFPEALIQPIAHGMSGGSGFKFMRAFYGILVCGVLAVICTMLMPNTASTNGLTIWSLKAAMRRFKGADRLKESTGRHIEVTLAVGATGDATGAASKTDEGAAPESAQTASATTTSKTTRGAPSRDARGETAVVALHPRDLQHLGAESGDLLFVTDRRWWLGGLRSLHCTAAVDQAMQEGEIKLSPEAIAAGRLIPGRPARVELIL